MGAGEGSTDGVGSTLGAVLDLSDSLSDGEGEIGTSCGVALGLSSAVWVGSGGGGVACVSLVCLGLSGIGFGLSTVVWAGSTGWGDLGDKAGLGSLSFSFPPKAILRAANMVFDLLTVGSAIDDDLFKGWPFLEALRFGETTVGSVASDVTIADGSAVVVEATAGVGSRAVVGAGELPVEGCFVWEEVGGVPEEVCLVWEETEEPEEGWRAWGEFPDPCRVWLTAATLPDEPRRLWLDGGEAAHWSAAVGLWGEAGGEEELITAESIEIDPGRDRDLRGSAAPEGVLWMTRIVPGVSVVGSIVMEDGREPGLRGEPIAPDESRAPGSRLAEPGRDFGLRGEVPPELAACEPGSSAGSSEAEPGLDLDLRGELRGELLRGELLPAVTTASGDKFSRDIEPGLDLGFRGEEVSVVARGESCGLRGDFPVDLGLPPLSGPESFSFGSFDSFNFFKMLIPSVDDFRPVLGDASFDVVVVGAADNSVGVPGVFFLSRARFWRLALELAGKIGETMAGVMSIDAKARALALGDVLCLSGDEDFGESVA